MKLCVGARAFFFSWRTASKHTHKSDHRYIVTSCIQSVSERAHSHRDRPASVSLHTVVTAHVTGLTRSHSSLTQKRAMGLAKRASAVGDIGPRQVEAQAGPQPGGRDASPGPGFYRTGASPSRSCTLPTRESTSKRR